MSLSQVFAPGTLFRARLSDDSKHYTAVLLKNGKVLEVKNPDTGVKSTFDSVELWQASHPDCLLEFDSSKASGTVISSDTNGFNYPTEKHPAYFFVRWLYSIVGEAAPQLLNSEGFMSLYNEMVELCNKHKNELYHYSWDFKGIKFYAPIKRNRDWRKEWEGYPGHLDYNSYNYNGRNNNSNRKQYNRSQDEEARKEIITVYKQIVSMVEPLVKDYMEKKYKILQTQKQISQTKSTIKRSQKKIDKIQQDLEWHKSYMEKELGALAKLEEEFIIFKTSAP